MQQHTISMPVVVHGHGLHTNSHSTVRLKSSPANTGVVFHVMLGHEAMAEIPATIDYALDGRYRTVLSHGPWTVSTPEHLLAAVYGLGISNLVIEIWGSEVPALDGSAIGWSDCIAKAGPVAQDCNVDSIVVLRPVQVGNDAAWCSLAPSKRFSLEYNLFYDHPMIGHQQIRLDLNRETFTEDLASARTFGFYSDLDQLQSMGLAHGSALTNTLVYSETAIMNSNGYRYSNEPVRHKLLDAVGDLSLAGGSLIGEFVGYRSGHELNQMLLRELFSDRQNYCWC